MKKAEKTNRCREILYKYPAGTRICNDLDVAFLYNIFEGHSEWDSKCGVGIDFFTVESTTYRNNKCFVIHRKDGTSTDISFVHSITNRSDLFNIKKACRFAVNDIITQFRVEKVIYGETRCPITGEILILGNTHIDHYNLTFNELFNEWVKTKDIKKLASNINETSDNNIITKFTDNSISDDFIIFHNSNTHLRAVSKIANLSLLKK